MSVPSTVIAALLGAAFLGAGVPKLLRTAHYREQIIRWRLPAAALPLIGGVEAAGAVLLLAGAATQTPGPAAVGAALVAATMAGAVLTHVRIGDRFTGALPAVVLGAVALSGVAMLAG